MKKSFLRLTATAAAVSMCLYHPAIAEDIDLFTSPGGSQNNPNVVIMIDNSANWDAANQHWPGVKQGQAELRVLRSVVGEVNDKMNLGLMMFTPGSGAAFDGGYVRYHVRQMTPAKSIAVMPSMVSPERSLCARIALSAKRRFSKKAWERMAAVGFMGAEKILPPRTPRAARQERKAVVV